MVRWLFWGGEGDYGGRRCGDFGAEGMTMVANDMEILGRMGPYKNARLGQNGELRSDLCSLLGCIWRRGQVASCRVIIFNFLRDVVGHTF